MIVICGQSFKQSSWRLSDSGYLALGWHLHKLDQRMLANNYPSNALVRVADSEALDAVAILGLRVKSLKMPADGGHGPRGRYARSEAAQALETKTA